MTIGTGTDTVIASVLLASSLTGLRISVGASLRPFGPLLLDASMAFWCWAVPAAVTGRPIMAALVVAGGAFGLGLVDRVKRQMLREPVVFADRAELFEVVRHPSLYLPFAGTWLVLLVAASIAAMAAILILFEPASLPLGFRTTALVCLPGIYASLCVPIVRRCVERLSRRWLVTLDPSCDMRRFGMLATFVLYAGMARAARRGLQVAHRPAADDQALLSNRPILLLQVESFFDVRRLDPAYAPVVRQFSKGARHAVQQGQLNVPCWGANTIRTEFAVLTGIAPASLGADGFNPYDRFARSAIHSIAWRLRAAGYRTIFVHPFDLRFYARKTVLPKLGFDLVIGPEAFSTPAGGGYVTDTALVEMVRMQMAIHGPRCFVFAVTMQGHGPWADCDATSILQGGAAGGALGGYLASVAATDKALPALYEAACAHDAILAVYGDHQPALPNCKLPADSATDYIIWDPRGGDGRRKDIAAQDLANDLYEAAALLPPRRVAA